MSVRVIWSLTHWLKPQPNPLPRRSVILARFRPGSGGKVFVIFFLALSAAWWSEPFDLDGAAHSRPHWLHDSYGCRDSSAERQGPTTFKDPAGNLRFRTGFGPKSGPNQAPNIRHGTHKPAHNDSERFWSDSGVFRRRSETFKIRDSSSSEIN